VGQPEQLFNPFHFPEVDQEELFAAPPAPVQPAGQEDIRGGILQLVSEPAGPLELPTMKKNMEGFFRHFESRRTTPTQTVNKWLWTEFSLDQSQADERESILAAIEQIKTQYPQDSLSPAQAKDILHEEVNRWLKERGRESLDLRKTRWP
jgi:hypothetical protein